MSVPRMRMFAGPNGSGKSTIKSVVPPELLGVYLNPDDIEKEVRDTGMLSLTAYDVEASEKEILSHFSQSTLLARASLTDEASKIRVVSNEVDLREISMNSYFASVIADFLRQKLLDQRITFSFETVMSSQDKVALLEKAQSLGYRTYLYYVATEDPEINLIRVRNRVQLGGHGVPQEKIISRYARSLDLLMNAIRFSNRAYLFDNSSHGSDHLWIAEITDGLDLETKSTSLPAWFVRAVLDKLTPPSSME